MDRSIPLLLIGLIFGGGIGFSIAAGNGVTFDGHNHADPTHHGSAHTALPAGMQPSDICSADNPQGLPQSMAHDHSALTELDRDVPAPTLALELQADPLGGYNLHVRTTHFTYAPQNASRAHVPGEGHSHVYINGQKLGRYYGPWVHLAELPAGDVTVEVTLNANDHSLLAVGGKALRASITIPD